MPGPAEPNSALAHWVMPPIAAAIVLCAIGALGIGATDAWLVPSLGSAIFVQVMTPKEPSASLWSTLLGQLVALPAGFIAVFVSGANAAPAFLSGHALEPSRLVAVAIAVILTILAQRALKATCPAGGAVALLVALGTTPPTWHGALLLGIGIVLVTILGEPCRMLILRQDKTPAKAEAKAAAD
ncbi:HPP family protein [Acidisoma sp.]|uniref:HPP family protein n=1 Tax=Acidisoma sp. TaxID=1872115 RepID=UPI003B0070F3